MCDFKTLYYGEEGYVIVCSQCNHFQLAFYSTLFTFTAGDFQVFHSLVRKNLESHSFSQDHSRKNIYIPAPQEGCGVILTIGELEVLFELLETAEVNYKAERLLELFKPT